jgi:hypothetical protein
MAPGRPGVSLFLTPPHFPPLRDQVAYLLNGDVELVGPTPGVIQADAHLRALTRPESSYEQAWISARVKPEGSQSVCGEVKRARHRALDTHGSERTPRLRIVLHVNDLSFAERQNLRPSCPRAVTFPPGERDRDPARGTPHIIQLPVCGPLSTVELDPRPEDLTGLVRAVSRRNRAPEPPAAPTPTPLHPLIHQRNKRLNIASAKSVIRQPDRLHSHSSSLAPCPRGLRTRSRRAGARLPPRPRPH